jgi:hypothetical protein
MAILGGWGERLTRTRDIALVGFGGVYAFGYLARALHAWGNNLGVLPGVEFQYFVAGLLLLVPPALVLGALFGSWRLLRTVAVWERRREGRRKRVDAVVGVLLFGGLIGFGVTSADWVGRLVTIPAYVPGLLMAVFIAAFAVNAALAMARPAPPASYEAPVRQGRVLGALQRIGVVLMGLAVVNFGLLVVSLLALAMLLGAAKILPVLPQALGGAAPQCAQFDIDVTKISSELAGDLFEPGPSPPSAAATGRRRSRQVLVHHSSGDSVLFKLPANSPGATYELKRSAIDAVLWCRKVDAARS